jgi:hypothetical protein
MLDYHSAGQETEVQLNKAMDIHGAAMEEEVTRNRAALQLPGGSTYDLITVMGTLTAKNDRKDTAKMKIVDSFEGELVSADGNPKTTKGVKALGELNPNTTLEWRPEVGAGDTLKLTYTYKVYTRTP